MQEVQRAAREVVAPYPIDLGRVRQHHLAHVEQLQARSEFWRSDVVDIGDYVLDRLLVGCPVALVIDARAAADVDDLLRRHHALRIGLGLRRDGCDDCDV